MAVWPRKSWELKENEWKRVNLLEHQKCTILACPSGYTCRVTVYGINSTVQTAQWYSMGFPELTEIFPHCVTLDNRFWSVVCQGRCWKWFHDAECLRHTDVHGYGLPLYLLIHLSGRSSTYPSAIPLPICPSLHSWIASKDVCQLGSHSICLSLHQSIHQSIHLSWCRVSAHTHVHGYGFPYRTRSSICLAVHLTIHLSTCPSIHLSVSLSTLLYFLYDAKGLQHTALKGVRVSGFISSLHLSIHLSIHPSTQSPYLSHRYTSCR